MAHSQVGGQLVVRRLQVRVTVSRGEGGDGAAGVPGQGRVRVEGGRQAARDLKQSLITAAVTAELDVTTVRSGLPG